MIITARGIFLVLMWLIAMTGMGVFLYFGKSSSNPIRFTGLGVCFLFSGLATLIDLIDVAKTGILGRCNRRQHPKMFRFNWCATVVFAVCGIGLGIVLILPKGTVGRLLNGHP